MALQKGKGFSLIEVLVSILVLALGVIGAGGLQLVALQTVHHSALQSVALQLATEMADNMRANDKQMKQSSTDNLFLGVDYQSAGGSSPQAPSKSCYASDCDASELAKFDIYSWEKRLAAVLPAGRVRICRDTTPWDDSAHALRWACNAGGGASMVIKIGWLQRGSGNQLAGAAFPPLVALTVEPYVK